MSNSKKLKKILNSEHVLVADQSQSSNQTKDLKLPCGPFIIKITVTRSGGTFSTLGTFTMHVEIPPCYLDDASSLQDVTGVTLELRRGTYVRLEKNGNKTYPIPTGTYSATKDTLSGSLMFRLSNVPNFEGIQIHKGNGPWNTDGCILVGSNSEPQKLIYKSDLAHHSSEWRACIELKFIEEIHPAVDKNGKSKDGLEKERGISDWVSGSGAKLHEMDELCIATKRIADRVGTKLLYQIVIQ